MRPPYQLSASYTHSSYTQTTGSPVSIYWGNTGLSSRNIHVSHRSFFVLIMPLAVLVIIINFFTQLTWLNHFFFLNLLSISLNFIKLSYKGTYVILIWRSVLLILMVYLQVWYSKNGRFAVVQISYWSSRWIFTCLAS